MAALAVAATLIVGGASAHAEPWPDADPQTKNKEKEKEKARDRAERESDLYEEGQEAIDEAKWDRAVARFTAVAEMKGSRADGALHWTAYALAKSGRNSEAMQTIAALRRSYPNSKWLDDANALELDVKRGLGQTVRPERIDNDELKVIAINSLMHTDPEKAYPLLEKIVRGPSDKKIKERALFILAQSPSPRSQALIADIARGNANPDLQRTAVKYIGIHGGAKNRAVLSELYASSSSREVKKEVLQAFMLSNEKGRVLEVAKSEKDSELREKAIHLLGIMSAKNELAALYATEPSTDVKKEIIQALFISNDVTRIGELARTERDPQLRRDAIRKLGLMGGSGNVLQQIYAAETSVEAKEAVIEAYFLQSNARALIDVARKEKNQSLRKEALQKLSIMNNDEALQYMLEILDEN
jgi:hypothetical protein